MVRASPPDLGSEASVSPCLSSRDSPLPAINELQLLPECNAHGILRIQRHRIPSMSRPNNAKASAGDLDAAAMSFSLTSGPPSSIRLDGLALTKLVKHSRDSHPHTASGLLLGLDLAGALEVTNLFGLPRNALRGDDGSDDVTRPGQPAPQTSSSGATKHIQNALGLLSSVNADANPVGIYVSSFLGFGASFTQQVLEGLKLVGNLMDKEGSTTAKKGGDGMERAVVLVHDLAQSAQGNTVIKAYRLTADFVTAYKSNDFSAKG